MPHKTPYNRRKMIRDIAKALERLELVTGEIERCAANNEAISIASICKAVNVSQSWLYYLMDNIDDIQIADELIDRYEYAKCLVKDVIIQEIDKVEEVREEEKLENGVLIKKKVDTALSIARDKLVFEKNKWKLSKLLPKTLGDSVNVNVTANKQVNDYSVTFNSLSEDQLKQLANLKLLSNRSDNDR